MLNRQPIFVNGFSRGGTTILTNLIASHPDVCTVSEVHHLFKGDNITDSALRVLGKCLLYDGRVIASVGQDFFSPRLIKPRRHPSPRTQQFIDRVIFKEKLRTRHAFFNRYKNQNDEYTRQEIAASRLVAKNVDGMIYATDAFAEMYPDATFIGLVRNGLALCEGHLRRGRPASELGRRYRLLGEKMVNDAEQIPHYRLYRFEDLMGDPASHVRGLYEHSALDIDKLNGVRMQIRRVMDKDGNHQLVGGLEWEVVWLDLTSLNAHFQNNVNDNQIKRLSASDRDAFLKEAGETMEKLGYSTEHGAKAPQTVAFPGIAADQVRPAA
jgi:hypothetical protein